MAAIEDAIVLGADVVNLSLGSATPGFATNDLYQDVLNQLAETDTVVTMSAGNSAAWPLRAPQMAICMRRTLISTPAARPALIPTPLL